VISISLTTAILVYTLALAGIFLVLYLYTEVGTRRVHRALAQQYRWRCAYCGFTYLDERAESVSECPRCHSFNDEVDGRPRDLRTHPVRAHGPGHDLPEDPRRNPSRRKRPTQRRRGPRRR